jgi:hypothetical protein
VAGFPKPTGINQHAVENGVGLSVELPPLGFFPVLTAGPEIHQKDPTPPASEVQKNSPRGNFAADTRVIMVAEAEKNACCISPVISIPETFFENVFCSDSEFSDFDIGIQAKSAEKIFQNLLILSLAFRPNPVEKMSQNLLILPLALKPNIPKKIFFVIHHRTGRRSPAMGMASGKKSSKRAHRPTANGRKAAIGIAPTTRNTRAAARNGVSPILLDPLLNCSLLGTGQPQLETTNWFDLQRRFSTRLLKICHCGISLQVLKQQCRFSTRRLQIFCHSGSHLQKMTNRCRFSTRQPKMLCHFGNQWSNQLDQPKTKWKFQSKWFAW